MANAALAAQQASGGAPIDLLLGGYHLAGGNTEARISRTVRDVDAIL